MLLTAGERYTLVVEPGGEGGPARRYPLRGRVLQGLAAAALLMGAAVFAGIAGISIGLKSSAEATRLKEENAAYQRQLERAEDMAQSLSGQIESLRQTEARLKQQYNYEASPVDEESEPSGSPAAGQLSPSQGGGPLAIGGRGGVEGGHADRVSPGFDLFISPQAAELEPFTPITASDPLTVAFTDLRSEVADTRRTYALLERHLEITAERLRHTPSIWPTSGGWISSGFGVRNSPFTGTEVFHDGLDFVADIGDPIVATADGVVTWASWANGMGLMVELDHGDGIHTRYGHSRRTLVRVGQKVRRGQTIARVGMTGNTTGPHVHYEVIKDGRPVDPRDYLADE